MNKTFPVDWRRVFRKASVTVPIVIVSPFLLIMILIFITSGFNYAEAMGKMSLRQLFTLLLSLIVISLFIAVLASQCLRIMKVSLRDGNLLGRNYWAIRKEIPLENITGLSFFSSCGIEAVVVQSKDFGEIYILEQTREVAQLLQILHPYLPANNGSTLQNKSRHGTA